VSTETKIADVVEAARIYEAAWKRYAGIEPGADSIEVRLAKAAAHQALLDAVRLADLPDPVAAAVDLGRAAGWREAIEALRDWDALGPFVAEYRRPLTGYDSSNIVLAAFLESLAPKETP
jgi:hypothetical protein